MEISKVKDCEHCPNNPQATKPFIKTLKVSLKNYEELKLAAAAEGKTPDCYACQIVQDCINAFKE